LGLVPGDAVLSILLGDQLVPADRSIAELATILGHEFKRPELLERAVTHASAALETGESYQRLEFLGDRVLGLVMVDLLMRRFPDEAEGPLAKRLGRLADRDSLASIARSLSLADWIRVGEDGQTASITASDSVMADVLEAVLGAIYRDGGLEAARTAIEPLWAPLVAEQDTPPIDSKTELQEWVQARSLPLPNYQVVERTGPDHVPVFTVEVTVSGLTAARASAGSKRVAEQDAARALLAIIEADR
jgi:ribonuclease III